MKVGSAVLGLHIVAVVAFSLTQGCVTTESQGSGLGAGARHKGPWKHQHKGNSSSTQVAVTDYNTIDDQGTDSIYDPVIIESTSSGGSQEYVPPVTPTSNTDVYIVQKGDILGRIAVKFDTTTQTLISMNNLTNPDVLYVGQELRIPAGSTTSGQSSAPKTTSTVRKGGEYVVQKGDTLSGIAVAAGVSIDDLRQLNGITDDKIFADKTIDIPAGGKVPTKTQKVTPKKPDPVEETPADPAVLDPEVPAVADPEVPQVEQLTAVIDHVVYPGETLEAIARQYGVGKSEIMRLNNITDETAIKEGQRLRIPIAE